MSIAASQEPCFLDSMTTDESPVDHAKVARALSNRNVTLRRKIRSIRKANASHVRMLRRKIAAQDREIKELKRYASHFYTPVIINS